MSQFWRTKGFKSLSIVWNKQLEQTGFKDAEIELKGDRALKQRSTNAYRQATQLERDTRLDYYMLLGQWVNQTQFPNDLERYVMSRCAEGATIQEIISGIQRDGLFIHRQTVRHIIRRWQMKWGIKYWTPKQMNLKNIR